MMAKPPFLSVFRSLAAVYPTQRFQSQSPTYSMKWFIIIYLSFPAPDPCPRRIERRGPALAMPRAQLSC
eukprot:4818466-Prymnesium_polylepis.1